MTDERTFIDRYNEISYEIDQLYTQYAASCSLSDSEMWILYIITLNGGEATQSEVCKAFSLNRKTVNSAVTKLEKQEILVRRSGEGKKVILSLTSSGLELAERTVKPLLNAEKQTIKNWSEEERNTLLTLTEKYLDDLRQKLSRP